ncbi:hypothetical protein Pyrfu_0516 [Pyrolobus fumarii 1A]|uniref:Bacterial Pleckstrin homology domain-containing protein n=1 Tax=Pyrolobus fumarii (strain DSM 11204 / 1A) TaxID=694429 RepID=G0EGL3_PYRF1|nr:hypothetical protein [Pyrolobus fumarii]AEM38387.1 hypothetical protein Pyrfu_0516 [Pyrolobus fumarii 1A]
MSYLYAFRLSSSELVSLGVSALAWPLFIIATGFVAALALVIIARQCGGVGCALRSPFFWLVVVLGVILPAVVMVFDIVTTRAEYVVTGNCTLVVDTSFGSVRVSLPNATVTLTGDPGIKLRKHGIGVPGLLVGRVELSDGSEALAIVYRPPGHYLVVKSDGETVILSHPGIEEVYEKIMSACRATR